MKTKNLGVKEFPTPNFTVMLGKSEPFLLVLILLLLWCLHQDFYAAQMWLPEPLIKVSGC